MTALLSPRVWMAIGLAVILALSHAFIYRAGRAAVRVEFDAYKLNQAEQRILADRAQRTEEQRWQSAANQVSKDKDEAILNINSRLDDALGKLRDRPVRPIGGDVRQDPRNCQGATGAGLYAEDGQFLVREAARADKLRAALGACYSQYEALTMLPPMQDVSR